MHYCETAIVLFSRSITWYVISEISVLALLHTNNYVSTITFEEEEKY